MMDSKPYRPNVGIVLFNASGQVLIGRRFRDDGPEIILPGLEWQMPQGGTMDRNHIGSQDSAASARNGSRCVSPAPMTRLIRWRCATASLRNSTTGDGNGSIASPISSCRSGARSIGRSRSSLLDLPDLRSA